MPKRTTTTSPRRPSFQPVNDVEHALKRAFDNRHRMPEFLQALSEASLFLPTSPDSPPDELTLLNFELEGRRYVPVFTSAEQLEKASRPGTEHTRVQGAELAAVWPAGQWMAINPGGELGLPIAPDAVAALAGDRAAQDRAQKRAASEVVIGAPASEPDVLERLREWARDQPAVRAGHRAMVLAGDDDTEPVLVIGFELDEGTEVEPLFDSAAEAADAETIGFTPIDRDKLDDITRWMVEHDRPFYRRGKPA